MRIDNLLCFLSLIVFMVLTKEKVRGRVSDAGFNLNGFGKGMERMGAAFGGKPAKKPRRK